MRAMVLFSGLAWSLAAWAADTPPASAPSSPQAARMKQCSAQARTRALHGDARRAFMKRCLSGRAADST